VAPRPAVVDTGRGISPRNGLLFALLLAALAVAAYLPTLFQPYIADDYVQVNLARRYGPVSGWGALLQDALYRCRATSLVMTWWTERLFGVQPAVLYATAIGMHVLNTWLVALLGAWPWIGWRISIPTAAFFAVAECHNEAVYWYAALPELLVFFFVLLCVHVWVFWLESGRRYWFAAAFGAYLLALASKESAAVVPLFLAASVAARREWRRMIQVAPFLAVAAIYAYGIAAAKTDHLHLNDGTFSLNAPVLLTLRNSVGRLLWVWGFLALLVVWRKRLAHAALVWIVLAFLPYSFLAYMPRVPSRHTYLASAGLALMVGFAWVTLRDSRRLRTPAWLALAAIVITANAGYLWTRKRAQFLERAAPTEALVRLARQHSGEIHVRCFPYSLELAVLAVEMAGDDPKRLIMLREPPQHAADFCWAEPAKVAEVAGTQPPSVKP
jgi:hypothetical protein